MSLVDQGCASTSVNTGVEMYEIVDTTPAALNISFRNRLVAINYNQPPTPLGPLTTDSGIKYFKLQFVFKCPGLSWLFPLSFDVVHITVTAGNPAASAEAAKLCCKM